jgi:hypothetical protein
LIARGDSLFEEPPLHGVAGERQRSTEMLAEAKDVVNGYMLIEAADIEQAVELSKGCPILDVGGSVEVRPLRT